MNSQWMTSLQKQIRKELESRGLRWDATDIAAFVEDLAPVRSRVALGTALSYLRPFSAGLGLRVARLSDRTVEVMLPAKARNLNEHGVFHEGVLIAAATEAVKILWTRHAPLGEFEIETRGATLKVHRGSDQDLRGRAELSESVREGVLSQLRQTRRADVEMDLRYFDGSEHLIAEATFSLRLKHTPQLEAPEA